MTQETLTGPREPVAGRFLNVIGAALAVVFWAVLVWQQLDPDGPREWLVALKWRIDERRRYRSAMLQTLEQIDDLPETDELDDDGARG